MRVVEYLDSAGHSPFAGWFDSLDSTAAAKVTVALTRMHQGQFVERESGGAGLLEYRIDFGPGYRLYFGREGDHTAVLLAGGTKSRQQRDIVAAQTRWADYKKRRASR